MLGKKLIQAAAVKGGGAELGIEDVFSTWLYTANGSPQTITNGIDLAGEGGLVWTKSRENVTGHRLSDTIRGAGKTLSPDTGDAEVIFNNVSSFDSDGFTTGTSGHVSGTGYVSWTFRKAEKFFDVVTYVGDGVAGRTVAHNLGSVPGCIIIKQIDQPANWPVYHRSIGHSKYLLLNATNAAATTVRWNNTDPTSTDFTVDDTANVNAAGGTFVAYLFAHDAGGFGNDGTESVIKCGSYTGNGSTTGPVIDLGWEPQWILIKRTDAPDFWEIIDAARGMTVGGNDNRLQPNSSGSEITSLDVLSPTSTGFQLATFDGGFNSNNSTYIYIAIRRGPMKKPTDATTVFNIASRSDTYPDFGFPADLFYVLDVAGGSTYPWVADRLRGPKRLIFSSSNPETDESTYSSPSMDGNNNTYGGTWNDSRFVPYGFRRAHGFFDMVAYTGTGVARTVSHNLGVAPEMMIIKTRNSLPYANTNWIVYHSSVGTAANLNLNESVAKETGDTAVWNSTSPTASVFSVGTPSSGASQYVNTSGGNYIAYLFATCPGVSKVGSYTGTGTTLNVDCGFASGARFVLIKRTDSTGDWYVWDTARGIVSGNDPYLLLNSTAAEVTSTDYIDPLSSGFQISSSTPAAINANGGSYIFLAIA